MEVSMSDTIRDRLSSLPDLEKEDLCRLWNELFRRPPSPEFRRDFMIPILAYRLQENSSGSLPPRLRSRLRQLANSFEADPSYAEKPKSTLRSGTRLVRQWKEQVHVVTVENGRYEYHGVRYRSLSQIARLITGTRWSGPLFFGIKQTKNPNVRSGESQ